MGTMTVETTQMKPRTAGTGNVQQIISSMYYVMVLNLESSIQEFRRCLNGEEILYQEYSKRLT
jgi:nucleoside diphosphate kinase